MMMIRRLIYFLLIPFFCLSNYEELFLQANKAYEQKEYAAALALYEKIEPKSGVVLYNMGNCLYRLGEYVPALISWKRAEKKGFGGSAIEHNCQKVFQELKIDEPNNNLYFNSIKKIIQPYSLFFWQFLFLASWYILLFGVCWMPLLRKKTILLLLLVSQSMVTCGLGLKIFLLTQNCGIIKQEALLYAGMNENFNKRGKVFKGQEVKIHETRGTWCKVSHDQNSGWLKTDTVEYVSC